MGRAIGEVQKTIRMGQASLLPSSCYVTVQTVYVWYGFSLSNGRCIWFGQKISKI